jgi:hypothetical protein
MMTIVVMDTEGMKEGRNDSRNQPTSFSSWKSTTTSIFYVYEWNQTTIRRKKKVNMPCHAISWFSLSIDNSLVDICSKWLESQFDKSRIEISTSPHMLHPVQWQMLVPTRMKTFAGIIRHEYFHRPTILPNVSWIVFPKFQFGTNHHHHPAIFVSSKLDGCSIVSYTRNQ